MSNILDNPVYHALQSGDKQLALGHQSALFFDEAVSPFAGVASDNNNGFDELFNLLPAGRQILFATPQLLRPPKGWQLLQKTKGLQMVYEKAAAATPPVVQPVRLQDGDIEQMMQLANLTKPGPFGPRTIEFGHYYGFFVNGCLVAMTGQRLHVQQYTEISAVCTHPGYLGKGYAYALVLHQINLIREQGKTPFLHVRKDNERAVALYLRLGFTVRGPMNFYALKKRTRKNQSKITT